MARKVVQAEVHGTFCDLCGAAIPSTMRTRLDLPREIAMAAAQHLNWGEQDVKRAQAVVVISVEMGAGTGTSRVDACAKCLRPAIARLERHLTYGEG